MKFLDQVKIYVSSGKGGNGCVSFRHEKYVEYGGPDGGNGGKGSNIIFETTNSLNTLIDFRYQQHFKGKNGENGKGKNMTGAASKNLIIKVPLGTQILSEDKSTVLADMIDNNQKFTLLKGGKGGLGNNHFKSSTNRAPRKFTEGEEGTEAWVWLSLKLIADVGIIGLPNAGKSSLLSKISSALPKIADYPFTTLNPVLGVVKDYDYNFVVADIPGLIEGAHEGKGLGYQFLKHIERTKILLFLIDTADENPLENYRLLKKELLNYNPDLKKRKYLIVRTKIDTKMDNNKWSEIDNYLTISSVSKEGIPNLINQIGKLLNEE